MQDYKTYSGYIDLGSSASVRLDVYISDYLKLFTRSQIKAKNLSAKLNKHSAKLSSKVKIGDFLELTWQDNIVYFEKEEIALEILFENNDVWVINKPQGMAVHPGAGRKNGTLANALAYKLGTDNEFGESERPGIVHRLDMDTSGVIVCAKNEKSHQFLAEQFKSRTTKKRYMAIVAGHITPITGIVDNYIDRSRKNRRVYTCGDDEMRGRRAVTGYRVLKSFEGKDLILFKPYTGRTHQLRVHAKHLNNPIIGDVLYNNKIKDGETLMLHAWKLEILLPNEEVPRVFCAKVPHRFYESLGLLE